TNTPYDHEQVVQLFNDHRERSDILFVEDAQWTSPFQQLDHPVGKVDAKACSPVLAGHQSPGPRIAIGGVFQNLFFAVEVPVSQVSNDERTDVIDTGLPIVTGLYEPLKLLEKWNRRAHTYSRP